jgi:hypothetical protein
VFTFPCLQNEQLAAADRPEESSSQGSTEPWDTTFNMALNAYKKRPLSEPPSLRLWYKCEVSRVLQRGCQEEKGEEEHGVVTG